MSQTLEPLGKPSLVVLAGGRGRRLGRDKAGLLLGDETLLERVLRRAGCLCADQVVVARRGQVLNVAGQGNAGLRLVYDEHPYCGALAGLAAGLAAAEQDWSLVLACDLPFFGRPLLRTMLTLRSGYVAVMPRMAVGDEPLHALYHKSCLAPIRRALADGAMRLTSFCDHVAVRYVQGPELDGFDRDGLLFFNINTAADLERARALLARSDD